MFAQFVGQTSASFSDVQLITFISKDVINNFLKVQEKRCRTTQFDLGLLVIKSCFEQLGYRNNPLVFGIQNASTVPTRTHLDLLRNKYLTTRFLWF